MNAPRETGCPCNHPCERADINSALLQHGDPIRFRRGEVLWSQDTPATRLVGVCTRGIKLVREWPGGRMPIMDLVFRGGVVGEVAALPGGQTVGTAIALSSGKGIQIPADRLQRLLVQRPDLQGVVLGLALQRQQVFSQRLDELGNGAVQDRLARVLLRIGDEVGLKDARGLFIPLKLSRGDLSEMVGCRVETAIRVMTRWQRDGIVETRREGLILRDRDRLEAAAELAESA
jgi:CRP/FNR family transcriptional regulator, nitrogen oxide reductase regulator